MKKAVVVGAGIGGLASAIRMAAKGYTVEVFEASDHAGGKIRAFEQDGYRFDAGPSLFTMPQLVQELFELSGKRWQDYFQYQKLDESCRYFWEDGIQLTGYSEPSRLAQEIRKKLNVPVEQVENYFDHLEKTYERTARLFLEKSLHKTSTWLSPDVLKSLLRIGSYDLFQTMNDANERRLQEPHLVQLFNRFATYNGSNPYQAPGILNVIPWLEHGYGTFFPKGGMQSIATALTALAEEVGVTFHFGAPVGRIVVEQSKACGLYVMGTRHEADWVISNADVWFTYRELMPEQRAPERTLNQERSSSALVYYWGVKGAFPKLGLHNIFFSKDSRAEFDTMFQEGDIAEDATVYVNVSSKCEPTDAPDGCENWFVMVNVPSDQGQDWEALSNRVRAQVLRKLSRILQQDLEALIVTERCWTPTGIEKDTWSFRGALYGTSSNDRLAAFLRHPNFSRTIANLHFCGGSVHPGGGIPLALLSARIATDQINPSAA